MKRNKLYLKLFLFILLFIPLNVLGYSEYIIPGGENIGIEVSSNGVLVVGFYKVNNEYIAKENGFEIGDRIIKINNEKVNNIDNMVEIVDKSNNDTIEYTIIRNSEEKNIKQNKIKEENTIKTGLYVKDKVIGIGTLTFIDPGTRKFGALGHEILEKTTKEKFEIKDGEIFKSDVTGIERSENGSAGEKSAIYDKEKVYGRIKENEESGIFGDYIDNLPEKDKLKVGTRDDIKEGPAIIRTVVNNNEIKEYSINIIKINKNSDTKNILFEVTDKTLINSAGGIVQGMSGSPIIQNNLIVGAVTHVIVNDTKKGYGIFVTTMLEESEN
ncbi:MAG: SpoIVB peptidase [Bacilli bacterium]|nr:SpoIVB peptidase [Bacilli bacterium]